MALTLPVAVTAATNPAGGVQTPSTTSPVSGTQNPATAGGQGAINAGNTTAGGANTNQTGSSLGNNEPAQPIANESVKDAVADCPLVEAREEVMEEAMRIATIKPDIDAIFNDKSEAAAGCFAASSKVINLAMEIPSVSFSLTGMGDLVKKRLEKMLLQKADEVLSKGCAIADTALLGALEPMQKYLDDYSTRVGDFNGMIGNIQMDSEYEGSSRGIYDGASDLIKDRISGSKANILAGSQVMQQIDADIAAKYKAELESNPIISSGNNSNARSALAPTNLNSSANSVPTYSAPVTPAPTQVAPSSRTFSTPTMDSGSTSSARSNNPFSTGNSNSTGNPF